MRVTDSQPIRRVVHVCTDAGLGATIAPLARQQGFAYLRFDHAFAACLELLRGDTPSPAVLLVALDGLARVEADLLTWARSRWAELPIWVHGSTARLNGHLAQGRVKLIKVADLTKLLADLGGPPVAELRREPRPQTHVAQAEFTSPAPTLQQMDEPVEAADPAGIADEWGEPTPPGSGYACEEASDEANATLSEVPYPSERVPEEAINEASASPSEMTDRAEAAPQKTSPPLRLRPLDPADRAVLTPEELAALLGPEGIHGG
jgi:hypothetical protein